MTRMASFCLSTSIVLSAIGCQQQADKTANHQPQRAPKEANDPEPRPSPEPSKTDSTVAADSDSHDHDQNGPGMMRRGPGMMGRGPGGMQEMRGDMMTLHALFNGRDKIKRTIKNLPNGVETLTESDDEKISSALQEHVPAMEGRVATNKPLPPMTFHPLFQELIKHASKVDFVYEDTDHGIKVTYTSDDPYVVMIIQEHAKLVSRFIQNGMEEIHKPYKIPSTNEEKPKQEAG